MYGLYYPDAKTIVNVLKTYFKSILGCYFIYNNIDLSGVHVHLTHSYDGVQTFDSPCGTYINMFFLLLAATKSGDHQMESI